MNGFEIYPAIDLFDGRVVRLRQGSYADSTVYSDDPVEIARGFVEVGARWIHVVDLDAARSADTALNGDAARGAGTALSGDAARGNGRIIAAICAAIDGRARLQVGGGVRTVDAACALADAGVGRLVIGSAAVTTPEIVDQIVDAVAAVAEVAVGLDHRQGRVAVHGWTEDGGITLEQMLGRFPRAAAFVITDIARDGMLVGPDIEGLRRAAASTTVPVIASGGVGSLADLDALSRVPGVGGAIVGKALYEGRFSLADALGRVASRAHPGSARTADHRHPRPTRRDEDV